MKLHITILRYTRT